MTTQAKNRRIGKETPIDNHLGRDGQGFDTEANLSVGARAHVIHPYLKTRRATGIANLRSPQARLDEAVSLAAAIDLQVWGAETVALSRISPATHIGSGKVKMLAERIETEEIELIVFDGELSPIQQRNLERGTGAKVIDRTGLILEIFGARAATREGTLQVELAHLDYQMSRLVRSWTHLERQRGGFGFLGGPGERQIESDRRLLRERIAAIRKDLSNVTRTRSLHRSARKKVPFPIVALVGYTNAGKSTLFNHMTKADVMAEDLLFATLDPTMRALTLPAGRKIILSDTVGFISDLPTSLIAAFRATLEEVIEADLILEIRDQSHPDMDAQAADVADVLEEIGVDLSTVPQITVLNKVDLLDDAVAEEILGSAKRQDDCVAISAKTGQGLDLLEQAIAEILDAGERQETIVLEYADGRRRAWLHAHAKVLSEDREDGGIRLSVQISNEAYGKYKSL